MKIRPRVSLFIVVFSLNKGDCARDETKGKVHC